MCRPWSVVTLVSWSWCKQGGLGAVGVSAPGVVLMSSSRVFEIVAGLSWSSTSAEPTRLADELLEAARSAAGVDGAGLAWMSGGVPGSLIGATDEPARRIEELQFTVGEGPCIQGALTGRPVLVEDLALSVSVWPVFSVGALKAGVAAVFAFPLRVGETVLGVLDLYRRTPGPLSPPELAEASAFTTVATWVLLHLSPGMVDPSLFPDLTERVGARAEIHRAAGVLAVQLGMSPSDALTVLRARAFTDRRTIADLARGILAQTAVTDR